MIIKNKNVSSYTVLSNHFVDEYMAEANGEFVKIYLYLLRLSQNDDADPSVSYLADRLNHTEKDVLRGLRYWEKQGLLQIEESDGHRVQSLTLLPVPEKGTEENRERKEVSEVGRESLSRELSAGEDSTSPGTSPEVHGVSAEAMDRLQKDEEFRQILFVAETYLGRTLTPKDIQLFGYLYEELKFPEDLLEYLVEYCVGGGHRSCRYMESVALNWHQEGKMTVQLAKEGSKVYSRENKQVMKAFGIAGRVLTMEERKAVERWIREYHLPLEVVVEGCSCTMSAIHQPSFEYTEKILDSWRQAGIRTVQEAREYRENRKIASRRKSSGEGGNSRENSNRFQNYNQRNVDYDELLRQDSIHSYGK
ncbi:MAG: DnaD domain protein [Clostridiales bacterium]|nr:DnaD domain protein [Clostridiales bacterium]